MTDPSPHSPSPSASLEEIQGHARFVRRLAKGLIRGESDALDASQDTWLAALEHPPRGHEPRSVRAFLAQVTRRVAWRRSRSEARRRVREESVARPESVMSAADKLAREQALRGVTDAVLALEEPYKETVLLRYYEGLGPTEIARRLGVPVATVKSRLQRALSKLRGTLDDEHGGDRGAWCTGLIALVHSDALPTLAAPTAGPVGATTAAVASAGAVSRGALFMTAKLKLSAACAALVVGTLASIQLLDSEPVAPESAPTELVPDVALTPPTELATPEVGAARADEERASAEEPEPAPVSAPGLGSLTLTAVWHESGLPAAGRTYDVLAWGAPPARRSLRVTTDENGRALLEGLPPGTVSVYGVLGGLGSGAIVAGEHTDIESRIAAGATIRGRVVDSSGSGVPTARIWLPCQVDASRGALVAHVDPDGSFEVTGIADAFEVGAIAEGYGPSELVLVSQLEHDTDGAYLVELLLEGHGARLELSVVHEDGSPAAHADVRLTSHVVEERTAGGGLRAYRVPSREGRTDEHGKIAFGGLPSLLELGVLGGDAARHTEELRLELGATLSHEVQLLASGTVEGTVRLADGTPAAGVRVALGEDYDPLMPMTMTDAAGHYRLEGLPAGELELRASHRELGGASTRLEVRAGEVVAWDPSIESGRVVAGVVREEQGGLLANWDVRVRLGRGPGLRHADGRSWLRQTRTDAEGRFRVPDCPEGELWVEARQPGRATQEHPDASVRASGLETVVLVREATRSSAMVRVRCLDDVGEPLRGHVSSWAVGTRGTVRHELGEDGTVVIGPLRPGLYDFVASPYHGQCTRALGRLRLTPKDDVDLGTVTIEAPGTLEINLGASEFQSARIFRAGPDESSRRGARILQGDELTQPVELLPGDYLVQFQGGLLATEVVQATVTQGQPTVVTAPPSRPGRHVAVTVRSELEQDPEWFGIRLLDAGGSEYAAYSAALMQVDGAAQHELSMSLGIGQYTLSVTLPDGTPYEVSVSVPDSKGPPIRMLVPIS